MVVPLDLVDREGNLLDRLELDDVGHLLRLDGRQLGETGKGGMARHGHHQVLAFQRLLTNELAQGETNNLVLVDVRGGQNPLQRNDREVGDGDLVAIALQPKGLDGMCADFHPPGSLLTSHVL